MKYSRDWCTVLTLVLIVFAFWSCATTNSAGVRNREGQIETTPQIAHNLDYTVQRIDANISSDIKMKFAADELISASNINVDTSHCNVTLKGRVDTQAEADRAMKLGRSANGVRSVRSDLIVKSTNSK
ncbi:BON domain-containing protein [bacterium]|nr:BON domain-containing protein [bacterium]MCI0603249.1 BON domain-containing protein [bacterium]